MPTLTFTSRLPVSVDDLFAWHTRPGAFDRLAPPWIPVTLEHYEGLRDGQRAVFRLGPGQAGLRWVAEHHDYMEGRQFCDRQIQGPFTYWDHLHRMVPDGPDAALLIDQIDYAVPLGGLGNLFGEGLAQTQIERQFAYRHRITRNDLALHRCYNPGGGSLRVAISGASGLIGSSLAALLTTGGHEVLRLVRSPPTASGEIYWNHRTCEIEAAKLEGLDAVVHLAGENVFTLRWTEAKKHRIRASRVEGTRLLSETLAALAHPPTTFLCASGIGIYGDRGDAVLTEAARPGKGFLADIARAWEAATRPAIDAGIRTVNLRIGVVLSPQAGALRMMLPAFQLGLGGRVGPNDAYVSWIALDDVLGAIYHALTTDEEGPLNLTAPSPATMAHLTKTLARVLRRPAVIAVPGAVARLAGGQMADAFLTSIRLQPQRLQQSGYNFLFPDLDGALRHQLGRT